MTDTIIRQLKDRYPHAAFVTATQPLSAESFILQKEKQEAEEDVEVEESEATTDSETSQVQEDETEQ